MVYTGPLDPLYNPQGDVAGMMRAFGQEVRSIPGLPDAATRLLRARLILEEALETICKGLGVTISTSWGDEQYIIQDIHDVNLVVTGPGDIVELADGTADLKVVTYGTDNACGINGNEVFAEVMRSNNTKIWSDGTVHKNEFGKVIKPESYSPANVRRVLGLESKAHGGE